MKYLRTCHTYLSASSCASSLKSSTRKDKSVVNLNIKKYKSTKRNHPEYHRLKYVHIILDVYFTVSENIKGIDIYALEHLYYFNIIEISISHLISKKLNR